ncbi:MAG TPA: ComE operon protein 2 [Pseudogracilibacillus sp.]|nr:ComE operon protein 2 [Pseudogracilibacillus sp.]
MTRINWQQYFLAQAKVVSLRSTCTRLEVGAILVRNNRIIASGYNGSVDDSSHCIDEGCLVVNNHCVRTVHAEMNALIQCARFGVATENTQLYVTHFPCLQCAKHIVQAGIEKIYYEADYRNDKIAEQLFKEANIDVQKVPLTKVVVEELE